MSLTTTWLPAGIDFGLFGLVLFSLAAGTTTISMFFVEMSLVSDLFDPFLDAAAGLLAGALDFVCLGALATLVVVVLALSNVAELTRGVVDF